MNIELEFSKTDSEKHEIFYRYNIDNKYLVWFTQHQDNGKPGKYQNCRGCIFQVAVIKLGVDDLPPLRVYERVDSHLGYPNTFSINWVPPEITLENVGQIQAKMQAACEYLKAIQDLLYSPIGKHYQLFKTRDLLDS